MTNKIKEYSKIEAVIAALAEKYAIIPDCSNDSGLKLCKKSYREIRKFEIDLEAKRKELGAEARKHLKAIGDEAKAIDTRLKEISAPFKLAFEQREQDIKEAEAKRVADIRARIDQLNEFVTDAQNEDSAGITAITEAIDLIDCSVGFEEFTAEALNTKQKVLSQLGTLLQNKLAAEGAERDRLAAQKMQQQIAQQQKIETRINNLRMIPIDLMGKPAAEIAAKLKSLNDYAVPAEDFGDRYQEAIDSKAQVIQQVSMMLENQKLVEDAQDKADREAELQRQQEERARQAEQARETEEAQAASQEVAASTGYTVQPEPQQRFIQPTGRNPQPSAEAPLLRPADTVSISSDEYAQLQADSRLLAALVAAGVDSWDGYDHAIEMAEFA